MKGRNTPDTEAPLSKQATGLWFKVPGKRGKYQRYDEAAPHDGSDGCDDCVAVKENPSCDENKCSHHTVHWYLIDGSWHAFRTGDVRPTK
jgi:hypothetical protein